MSETYAEPIHYKDASGKFQDIDNSLVEVEENGEKKLRNAGNGFSVEFPKKLTKNTPVYKVEKDGYELEMFWDGAATEKKNNENDKDKTNRGNSGNDNSGNNGSGNKKKMRTRKVARH